MSGDDDTIALPVPESVGAVYLVPATRHVVDPVAALRPVVAGRWAGSLQDMVDKLLAAPFTPIEVRPAEDLPPPPVELFAVMGATAEQLRRVRTATDYVVVSVLGMPGWPPSHEWVTRAIASALADQMGSDVIDVLNYQVLSVARAEATLPDRAGRTRLADWIWVDYSPDRTGYWCTTAGLRRFGLPELQTLAVPPNAVERWGNVMTGIAGHLVRAWGDLVADNPGAAFQQLHSLIHIAADDVAVAYGGPDRSGGTATVRLTLDPPANPQHHSYLTVNPPLTWAGSAGEHITDACTALFGAPTTEIRHIHRTAAMDRAIATARGRIDEIRHRFDSGRLDLHTKLLVKYALPAEHGTEYLWAYVTSWRDPDRILATSADDAVYHPKVRAGRPVVVDAAAVIDWAVEHDERGLVEGAWTQAALEH